MFTLNIFEWWELEVVISVSFPLCFLHFQISCVKVPTLVIRKGDRWGGLTPHSLGVFA